MDFNIKQLAEITGAKILKSSVDENLRFEISTDTRTIDKTKVFIPLIGEKFDGHNFIEIALENGALGYFTQKNDIFEKAQFILKVEDTLEAYLKIANYYKRLVAPKTIAITGSAGKTTTKEIAYHIFKTKYKTHKSALNHNNEIGLAQTLLSMPKDTEILIVEMGMRGLGEIELLSKYAEPDIAIITNIGSAHIGRLGSKENIAIAKFEITKHLNENGVLITHENKYLNEINNIKNRTIEIPKESNDFKILKLTAKYSRYQYKNAKYKINISGEYNIQNSLLTIEAALRLGLNSDDIAIGLKEFKQIQNRWQIKKILNANIINDAYNANPESMVATIKNFVSVYEGRKILVLGDMGELGENEIAIHKELGEAIRHLNYDLLITVGKISRNISDVDTTRSIHYVSLEGCYNYLKNNIKNNDCVLLKASRSMGLDRIVGLLKKYEENIL